MRRGFLIFLAALICSSSAFGELIPKAARGDKRVRFVRYDAANVVHIKGFYGYQTFILFSDNEMITDLASGDTEAWAIGIVQAKNGFFIKPRGHRAATNLTVITTKHHYNFDLTVGSDTKDEEPYYMVQFTYPNEEKKAKEARDEKDRVDLVLKSKQDGRPLNWNYWWDGSDSLKPIAAWDNGTFTYFKFAPGREFPSIFVINDEDADLEATVNTHVEGDTIVVHKIAKAFVLRIGNKATGVWNKSYSPTGVSLPGTISPHVERKVKPK